MAESRPGVASARRARSKLVPDQADLLVVLLLLIDGYDITAIAFAAPHLVHEWGLKPGSLGPVFSASLVGILFGSACSAGSATATAARRH